MKLSDQAMSAIMGALQKCILEQSDIVPVLKKFKFRLSEGGLMILNPPLVKLNEETEETLQESFDFDVVTPQSE